MKNYFLSALLVLLAMPFVWGQPVGNSQPTEKLEEIASSNLERYDTWNALDYFKQVRERKPEDVKANYDVAYTYFLLRDYASAEKEFQQLIELDKENFMPMAGWYYAQSLKLAGKYSECIPAFESFKSKYNGEEAERMKTLADTEIAGAKWAQTVTSPKEELIIKPLDKTVNSPLMENYAYPVGRNKMIFSALRGDSIIVLEDAEEEAKFARIFVAEKAEDGEKWEKVEPFSASTLTAEGAHVVNPTFNQDMSRFFFAKAQLVGNQLENSKIYGAGYDGTNVTAPTALDFNDGEYSCKNPAVGMLDGQEVLFFSSNMPGGKGGFDIWYAEINADGTTRTPLNLEAVNSVGDESHPFFDERDNRLYFASNGHPGMGGIDLFQTERNEAGAWSAVENMGPGFNTSVDEFGFIVTREGRDDCFGYLISNREGSSGAVQSQTSTDDIFSILMPERCDVNLVVKVTDDKTGEEVVGATVKIIDKETGEVVAEQSNTEDNKFVFPLEQGKEYEVVASKEGWETGSSTTADTRRPALENRFGSVSGPMEWEETTTLKEAGLMVQTFDRNSKAPLNGVTVMVYEGDKLVTEKTMTDGNQFSFILDNNKEYKIKARLEGYIGDFKTVKATEAKEMHKLYLAPPPLFVNVLFDFNKANIRTGAADTLDRIAEVMTDYPEMVVEVRGFTDAIGSSSYNDRLSNRRSKAAIDYLVEKGIAAERLIAKGFGEAEPVAPNEKEDGSDNPEGRQLNRRVEFKIIEGNVGAVEAEKKN